MIAAKLANLAQGQRQTGQLAAVPTQAEAAELLKVGERSVRRARDVFDEGAPELVRAVEQGKVPVSAAAEFAKQPVAEQQAAIAAAPSPAAAVRQFRNSLPNAKQPVEHPSDTLVTCFDLTVPGTRGTCPVPNQGEDTQ